MEFNFIFLNSIIYFLIPQSMHLGIFYKNVGPSFPFSVTRFWLIVQRLGSQLDELRTPCYHCVRFRVINAIPSLLIKRKYGVERNIRYIVTNTGVQEVLLALVIREIETISIWKLMYVCWKFEFDLRFW